MRKGLMMLFGYLLIFVILFAISFVNYKNNSPIVDIGLPKRVTNLGLLTLSFLGIVKSVWHIHRF